MSNQVLLWGLLIVPLLTLFFIPREDIKRFMPVALLAIVTSILVVQVGETLQWWHFKEAAYPLRDPSYLYSLNPIATILIFRFTYGRFWLFLAVDAVSNYIFSYLFIDYYLGIRDILQYLKLGPFHALLLTTVTGVLLYWYQMWQEGIFIRTEKTSVSSNLQPAATKLLDQEGDNNSEH
ncbi:Hypothetical protein LUCI_3812 [Lucifera butyrica]|uniref:Uncharacterized protein n=1 Tax=Lucifera butyrica TaxID=1351585 RepID=A0A498RAM4_9FIRM|nr:hypothetical protein [Lucifera butyrica]VBB08534.1 Hypothetical protein LUCI_3812 [Lucifera butyrica]